MESLTAVYRQLKPVDQVRSLIPAATTTECAACQGYGWFLIDGRDQDGFPRWRSCHACDAGRPGFLAGMGFAKNERILGFDDYDAARQPRHVATTTRALTLAAEWSEGKHRTVILSGPIGVGKTHLAKAAVCAAGLGNLRSHFISAADFEGRCKSFDLPDDVRRRGMQGLTEVDLLAFDDLGFGGKDESPYMRGQLETLFDGRYRRGLGAFVTTNLTRTEFAEYAGVRVLDRLMEGGQWLYMRGASLRGRAA